MFSLRQLKSFVTVAENKSFTKAAKILYMTQPAISAQIKTLEDRLEVQLLERNDKNIVLTQAGEIFYQEAGRIIALYHGFMEAIDELKGVKKGRLFLSASTIPGEYVLPGLIGKFNKIYPGVTLSLNIADTSQVVEQLLQRSIDVGVIGAPIKNDSLYLEEFLTDELIVIGGPDDPCSAGIIDLTELFNINLVLREQGSGTRMVFLDQLKRHGTDPKKLRVIMELGSTRAIITAVQSGLGLSVVSRLAAEDALKLGKIKEIKIRDIRFERSLYLTWHKNRYQSHAVKAFLKFLESQKTLAHNRERSSI